ncbi:MULTISPECIES: PadR family transcriptional regulator [unclassified Tolypothrix]|uniref:PadR family transcriptional regulator n=1 Tax=unclassified Tolypothrix TaxID=2649714 RepID=UPI0005EABF63|nr:MULTISPECIES: helix-turn-helix transcriptional regulator [unclassified Tolypothrix]EKE96403.1 putative PadR family transcriptional regulator [Tolypothrix sp. PCC 7601]MBE9084159.1 helix-turn-helix transcriptional regulator [Tolypothrix sp. LEGE 11397]UYD31049.1 helix-turn-helix transcriptional regulator [Tolypothrix sp. PCC 7712]BAY96035.1 transcriptional regulator, PadR family protein [Microchaete diplosiphon NIES-3275]
MAQTKKAQNQEVVCPLSDIEEIILSVLSGQKELYGLQISKTIEVGSEGRLQIGFGSLYPALRRLESRKLVESRWDNQESSERGGARRRYYKITSSGEESLRDKREVRESIANCEPVIA